MINLIVTSITLACAVLILFFITSKNENWENSNSSSFECGFTSYFYSRFSFSIHYLIISIIFLFFDLELSFLIPFLIENTSSLNIVNFLTIFVAALLAGLLVEWNSQNLEWIE